MKTMGIRKFGVLAVTFLGVLNAADAFARCKCLSGEHEWDFTTQPFVLCSTYGSSTSLGVTLNPQPMALGQTSSTFFTNPTGYLGDVETSTGTVWGYLEPVTGVPFPGPKFVDIGGVGVLPISSMAMLPAGNPYWKTRLNGSNRISIKGTATAMYNKSFCVTVNQSKDYLFLFGGGAGDVRVMVDGRVYVTCGPGNSENCGATLRMHKIHLTQGPHTFHVTYAPGTTSSPPISVWLEVYDMTWAQVQAAQSDADVKTVFSTRGLVAAGETWDYTGLGWICPRGSFANACDPVMDRCVTSIQTRVCQ